VSRQAIEGVADRCVPAFLAPHGEKVQYLVVGVFNTVVGYAVWAALYGLLSHRTSYATILVVAYTISIANAYAWYRLIVFRSHDSIWRELPRFSTVYLATMAVNLIVFPIAVRRLPWNAYAIQAVFTLGVVAASYTAHRSISFRASRAPSPATRATTKGAR
jgi:putative flippase GtrA